ncbi:MAG: AAA family ATPase [Candidatus Anammoxibacter sp.]
MGINEPKDFVANIEKLHQNLSKVIQGKKECIEILTIALLAGGSVLMEDIPGVGKTTLAKTLAKSIDVEFRRVQFTPDILPADILGSSIYNPSNGSFTFNKGPIFCNILLADEINRASPRTQSALLEAMSEQQVTIEGTSYPLHAPFLIIATQNPIDFHGTYPLPEAQLDRFLVRIGMGYPDTESEIAILYSQAETHPVDHVKPVVHKDTIVEMQQAIRRVRVDKSIAGYILEIVEKTRQDSRIKLGVSPRGSIMLFRASQAAAFTQGRVFVIPDDVQRLATYVFAHRIILTSKAKYGGINNDSLIEEILSSVNVPT